MEVGDKGGKDDDESEDNNEGDHDDEGKDEELELKWVPPQLNLRAGEKRSVQLILSHPTSAAIMAALTVKKGDSSLLVGLPAEVSFGAGNRFAEVMFQAGQTAGEVEVRATLPNGEDEDIEIQIRSK